MLNHQFWAKLESQSQNICKKFKLILDRNFSPNIEFGVDKRVYDSGTTSESAYQRKPIDRSANSKQERQVALKNKID